MTDTIILRRGDFLSQTLFRTCKFGHVFTIEHCPLCPIGGELEEEEEGRFGKGICQRCHLPFALNSKNQKRCPKCQVDYAMEREKGRKRTRRKKGHKA